MACKNCQLWYHPTEGEPEEAWCVYHPVWVRTRKDHFCGQQKDFYPPQTAWRRDRNDEYPRDALRAVYVQQARAVKAEKALKAARRKLREAGDA